MEDQERSHLKTSFTWHHYGPLDYTAIEARLPVVENSVIQTARGPSLGGITIVSNGEVTAGRAFIEPPSVAAIVLEQGAVGFYVPLHWAGELKFNGVTATPTAIHMPVDDTYFHICGRKREVLGCTLPRRRFIETVAALCGIDPHRLALHERALELAPEASQRLRSGLAATIDMSLRDDHDSTSCCAPFDLTNSIFELIVAAYLHARSEPMRKSGRVRNPGRVVRAAETRFAQADGNPVSLADLCAAAGVGKSALYQAFESFCGQSPIAYFHMRRISKARSKLLNSQPYRGAVKRAALDVGLTELGRFSRDYRRLFGESPSVTLSYSLSDQAIRSTASTDISDRD